MIFFTLFIVRHILKASFTSGSHVIEPISVNVLEVHYLALHSELVRGNISNLSDV